jgi:hypothetical protein
MESLFQMISLENVKKEVIEPCFKMVLSLNLPGGSDVNRENQRQVNFLPCRESKTEFRECETEALDSLPCVLLKVCPKRWKRGDRDF